MIAEPSMQGNKFDHNKRWVNLIILCQAVKPNHNLQYDIGTDFCIEDPVSTSFHLTINCPLIQEPQPLPDFQWNVTLNGTEILLDDQELSVLTENGSLTLNGTVNIGFDQTSTLDVTCEVSNIFGNDTVNTSISLCRKCFFPM